MVAVSHVGVDAGTDVEVDQPDRLGGRVVLAELGQNLLGDQIAARRSRGRFEGAYQSECFQNCHARVSTHAAVPGKRGRTGR